MEATKNLCINKMVVYQIPRLITVFVLCTPFLLVLSCGVSSVSLLFSITTVFGHNTKTITSWVDAQTAQMVSFEILLMFRLCNYSKRHAYIMTKSTKNEAKSTV